MQAKAKEGERGRQKEDKAQATSVTIFVVAETLVTAAAFYPFSPP